MQNPSAPTHYQSQLPPDDTEPQPSTFRRSKSRQRASKTRAVNNDSFGVPQTQNHRESYEHDDFPPHQDDGEVLYSGEQMSHRKPPKANRESSNVPLILENSPGSYEDVKITPLRDSQNLQKRQNGTNIPLERI